MNRVTGDSYEVPRYDPAYAEKSTCVDPDEYKIVKGQGSTNEGVPRGIPTRFKDPMEDINSAWTPHSVPGIKSQPWKYNYMDGSCGIRNLDKNYDRLDPELPDLELLDNNNCSNIRDNALHTTVPDKLIGVERVAESRRATWDPEY